MQKNDVTERTMEHLLRVHHNPPFSIGTIAESVHVLSEAGQVHFTLIYFCCFCHFP
jgi:hypothetical protein